MRDVLEQHGEVAVRLVGWGRRLQHGVVSIEVARHEEADVVGESEKLARLELMSLAPVDVVH